MWSEIQWGRRSSRRSGVGENALDVGVAGASMGPPFITAEWTALLFVGCAEAMRFNGAAVHHGGVGPETDRRPPSGDGASMGPPFITAEWGRDAGIVVVLALELQWGRRSSRRRGWCHRIHHRRPSGGFNGAAVHHGGGGQSCRRKPPW